MDNTKTNVIENHPIPEYKKLNLNTVHSTDTFISEERFKQKYINKGLFTIFEAKGVATYLEDVEKSLKGKPSEEITKGMTEAINAVSQLYAVKVKTEDGKFNTYYLKLKQESEIQKAQTEQKKTDTIEKGHISSAFLYSNNFKFNKTGKEIKDQIDKVISEEQKESEAAESELTKMAKDMAVNDLPTQESYIPSRFEGKIKSVYKKYRWERCYYNENDKSSTVSYEGGGTVNKATSQEDADFCSNWNKNVEKYYDSQQEVIILQTLKNNLQDKQKYELTQEQLFALNF